MTMQQNPDSKEKKSNPQSKKNHDTVIVSLALQAKDPKQK